MARPLDAWLLEVGAPLSIFAGLGITIYCFGRAIIDIGSRKYVWAAVEFIAAIVPQLSLMALVFGGVLPDALTHLMIWDGQDWIWAAGAYCLVRAIADLRRRKYTWGTFGATCASVVLLYDGARFLFWHPHAGVVSEPQAVVIHEPPPTRQ
jgi:hypothetical protein